MATLQSPGVSVTVIDESFYTPAEPGTTPLIVVASAANKTNAAGTATAAGTLAANIGQVYKITSQKELVDTYGVPYFELTATGNPVHGGERNEYGLLAAYSLLGVTNSVFIVRANIDLDQLVSQTTAPGATPNDGQWWLDTKSTSWGIQEWNGAGPTVVGGQVFNPITPSILTDDESDNIVDGDYGRQPSASFGSDGSYAVVIETGSAIKETARFFYKRPTSLAAIPGGSGWHLIGSDGWRASWPTVYSTGTVSVAGGDSGKTVTITGLGTITVSGGTKAAMLASLAGQISSLGADLGIGATIVNSKLYIYYNGQYIQDAPNAESLHLVDGTMAWSKFGIDAGTYYAPRLVQAPHTQIPAFKTTDVAPRPTGSVWIKTTEPNHGSRWRMKRWSNATLTWNAVESPLYQNTHYADYALDRANGGSAIKAGTLFTQWNSDEVDGGSLGFSVSEVALGGVNNSVDYVDGDVVTFSAPTVAGGVTATGTLSADEDGTITGITIDESGSGYITPPTITLPAGGTQGTLTFVVSLAGQVEISPETAKFRLWKKVTAGQTALTSATKTVALSAGSKTFTIWESRPGSSALSSVVVTTDSLVGDLADLSDDLGLVAKAINDNAYDSITELGLKFVVASVSNNKLTLTHTAGGEIRIKDTDGIIAEVYGNAYDPYAKTGTFGLYEATYVDSDYGLHTGDTSPHNAAGFDYLISNWTPLVGDGLIAKGSAPLNEAAEGTYWYNADLSEVDLMVHNGTTWVGYRTVYTLTDPAGPIISATMPQNGDRSDGGALVNNDIWINTADTEDYPIMYRYAYAGTTSAGWQLIDTSDQTTELGVLFTDARYGLSGLTGNVAAPIEEYYAIGANYLDFDAPEPSLYPKGMILWNTRRSTGNVKQMHRAYVDKNADNPRFNNNEAQSLYDPTGTNPNVYDRWVTASPNKETGAGQFGRHAQRSVIIKALKSVVDTNQQIRDEERRNFNLIAAPGYPELLSNLVNLNIDRGITSFVVGDTPLRLPADATSLTRWGTNELLVTDNGDDGIVTYDEYCAVFYPNGYTNDLGGNYAVVPASHMILKTIVLSDNVSYPWFAPAGTRRGGITNATAVGYIDKSTGEFQTVALNGGQRDTLYSLDINPVAFFVGVGLVNYGQKTRARNASSLDRINVARLVVYLRSQLQKLARPYIFEPNDKITRDEVKQSVESLLLELVGLRALYDFAVVCDTSNNTPARIDRNELWVDIAISPVKAVEFIYIPLRLKNTGEI